jgi:hypothetical protein
VCRTALRTTFSIALRIISGAPLIEVDSLLIDLHRAITVARLKVGVIGDVAYYCTQINLRILQRVNSAF